MFRSADQVYFLRYKHGNSATVILLWHAGLFTRSDLDRNSCVYNLRTFEFKHFGITWIITSVYSLKFFDKLPAPLEINSQLTATCLAHTLFFKVTTHHHIFWWCAIVWSAGCGRLLNYMQHVCQWALYCHKE